VCLFRHLYVLLAIRLTKVRVNVNQNYTENFEILKEVKQGDPLSASLFRAVIDDILKQLVLTGNI